MVKVRVQKCSSDFPRLNADIFEPIINGTERSYNVYYNCLPDCHLESESVHVVTHVVPCPACEVRVAHE